MDTEPWKIINHLFPDLVLVVDGKKLYYHQAVLVQHSALVKSLLLKSSCCKCGGRDCSRNSGNVFITLDNVKVETVQYVMDIIYTGGGNMAGDTEEYKKVVEMLQVDTILVDALDAPEGFVIEDIVPETSDEVTMEVTKSEVTKTEVTKTDITKTEVTKTEVTKTEVTKTEVIEPSLETGKKDKKKTKYEKKNKKHLASKEKKDAAEKGPPFYDVTQKEDVETIDIVEKPQSVLSGDKLAQLVEKYAGNKKDDQNQPKSTLGNANNKTPLPDSKKSKDVNSSKTVISEIVIDDDESPDLKDDSSRNPNSGADTERYCCPFKDCRSESKSAQSIKVHLALVHYKKTIQSEFPNWRRQKCDQCDKSFGQMTAYYLHMANHKRYPFMDLPGDALRPTSNTLEAPKATEAPSVPSWGLSASSGTSLPPPGPPQRSSRSSAAKETSSTIGPRAASPSVMKSSSTVTGLGLGRSNSFVQPRPGPDKNSQGNMFRSRSFVQQKSVPTAFSTPSPKGGLSSTRSTSVTPVAPAQSNGLANRNTPNIPANISNTQNVSANRNTSNTPANRNTSNTPANRGVGSTPVNRGVSSTNVNTRSMIGSTPVNSKDAGNTPPLNRNTTSTPVNRTMTPVNSRPVSTPARPMPPGPPASMFGPGSRTRPAPASTTPQFKRGPNNTQKRTSSSPVVKEGKKFRGF